jgi:hypothetical protein
MGMRRLSLLLVLLWSTTAGAKVVNVEFKFTPFVGDPKTSDEVQTVAGQAAVFINNLPVSEQPVGQQEVPVLFDDREIAPSVWVPVESLGPIVRKGKNVFRLEFTPSDATAAYHAQLRWALVNDDESDEATAGRGKATNQSGEGVEDKAATGKLVLEHEFVADFAEDHPWHHYPPVTELTDVDKAQLQALVKQRVDAFKPDFSGIYAALKGNEKVDGSKVKQAKCLDAAYKAGVRIVGAQPDKIEYVTTASAVVVVRSKDGPLFAPSDPTSFDKIKSDTAQMCVSMALFGVYPPQLAVVHAPSGTWDVAY